MSFNLNFLQNQNKLLFFRFLEDKALKSSGCQLLRYDRMTLILCSEERIVLIPALSYCIYQCWMLTFWNIVFGQRKMNSFYEQIHFSYSIFWWNYWFEFVEGIQCSDSLSPSVSNWLISKDCSIWLFKRLWKTT